MNPRYLKKQQQQTPNPNSSKSIIRDENASLGRNQYKLKPASLTKNPLVDLTNNQLEFKSQKKLFACDLPVQASTQFVRQAQKESSSRISASKWLDSEKQMMQFILSLKAKRQDQKSGKSRKITDGFEVDERRQQGEDLLCNRMLFLRKIQKHEKQAVNYFYQKDYQHCFTELSKAETLIRKQKIDSIQHFLYINYLYSEFYYKLGEIQKWRNYLIKARSYSCRVAANQAQQLKQYIFNVKALEVCLAVHDQQFERALFLSEQFHSYNQLSSKIRRRINHSRITSLHKLMKYKQAMSAIDEECFALESDHELNSEKQAQEIGKLLALKIEITAQFNSTDRAIELLQQIIGFQEVANGSSSNFSYYHLKVYQLYAQLLRKQKDNILKNVFFFQKWTEIEPSKKEKLKLQLQLFRMYFQLGIYQRALQLFDDISSQNVVYLGPEYLFMLAKIKHSYGQHKQAVGIMLKIIDLSPDEESRVTNSFRILQFDLQSQRLQLRGQCEKSFQKSLKVFNGTNHDQLLQLYSQYLRQRGEQQRANQLTSKLKKTGTFQEFYFIQKSEKKLSRK